MRVTLGNAGGVQIVADLSGGLGPDALVEVTLLQNYTMEAPPGFPSRPPAGGAVPFAPHTMLAGATVSFLKPEAAALVAAGVATTA